MADPEIRLRARNETKAAFAEITQSIGALKGALATIGVGVSFGAIVASFKSIVDQAENFNKLAQKTGIATTELSSFAYAAKLSDLSLEDLGTGLKKLAVNMVAAAGGAKDQAEDFKALGISVKDAGGYMKTTDQMLVEVANKFASVQDGAGKAAMAVALFGKSGEQMIPFLNNLRTLREESVRLGAVYGPDFAKTAEQFNDNLKRLSTTTEQFKVAILGNLIGPLADFTSMMVALKSQGNFWAWLTLSGDQVSDTKKSLDEIEQKIQSITKSRDDLAKPGVANWLERNLSPTGDPVGWANAQLKVLEEQKKALRTVASQKAFQGMQDPETLLGSGQLGQFKIPDKTTATGPKFSDYLKTLQNELAKTASEGNKVVEVQAAIASGTHGAASGPQAKEALRIAAEINQRESLTRVIKEEADARREEEKSTEEFNRTEGARLADLSERWKKAIAPELEYAQALQDIKRITGAPGRLTDEQGALARKKLADDFSAANDELVTLKGRLIDVSDAGSELGLVFQSAMGQAIASGAKFSDVLQGILRDILQITTQLLITRPLQNALQGLAMQYFGPTQQYGRLSTAGANPFGLQQYATGTDYVPRDMVAFVHKGERIIPASENKGGGVTVNVIGASGPVQARKREDNSGGITLDLIVGQISQQQAGDIGSGRGPLSSMLERTYGLSRVPGSFR